RDGSVRPPRPALAVHVHGVAVGVLVQARRRDRDLQLAGVRGRADAAVAAARGENRGREQQSGRRARHGFDRGLEMGFLHGCTLSVALAVVHQRLRTERTQDPGAGGHAAILSGRPEAADELRVSRARDVALLHPAALRAFDAGDPHAHASRPSPALMLFRPIQTNAAAKSRWTTANNVVSGRAPLSVPHTSSAAMAPNPTTLPRMMASRAVDGPAYRAAQSRAAIPRNGLPKSRR